MDTKLVRAALALAEHGSFTLAARAMFMAQSTLSRQVSALERELGVVLFVRGMDGVSVTVRGRAFMVEAERVLEAVARAEDAARRTTDDDVDDVARDGEPLAPQAVDDSAGSSQPSLIPQPRAGGVEVAGVE